MAFLQICRRQQAVFEGVTYSLQRLVARRSFHSSSTLHCSVQNQPVCPGKSCIRIIQHVFVQMSKAAHGLYTIRAKESSCSHSTFHCRQWFLVTFSLCNEVSLTTSGNYCDHLTRLYTKLPCGNVLLGALML